MNKKVLMVYFSGTGGTKRIADSFCEKLMQKECEVIMHSLEKAEYESYKPGYKAMVQSIDLLVLLYPVYATEAPMAVHEWISDLPAGTNKPTIVISVSGGGDVWPNTSCRVNVIKGLERKNYDVFYERMMVMPSNFYYPVNDHIAMHLLQCIPEKTDRIVIDILEGKRRRDGIHISTRLFSLMHSEKQTKNFGKSFRIRDNCLGCGLCVKNCPRENLKLDNGKPAAGDSCIACFRCIYNCPSRSIYFEKGNSMILKDGFNIEEVERRMQGIPLEPVEKCCKGILLIGVKKYLLEKD